MLNQQQLLRLAQHALQVVHYDIQIPPRPGAPAPFDKPFKANLLGDAIADYLSDAHGYTVILAYPDPGEGSYSSFSAATTWEEAVCEVAQEMLDEELVDPDDELEIVDVLTGDNPSHPGVDLNFPVIFRKGKARLWDYDTEAKESNWARCLANAVRLAASTDLPVADFLDSEAAAFQITGDEVGDFKEWTVDACNIEEETED